MSRLRFEIEPEQGGLPLPTYYATALKLDQILKKLDSAISGKGEGTVNWYVVDLGKNGTLALEVESQLKKPSKKKPRIDILDTSPEIAKSFVTGFENIEMRGKSPPYLSESGLAKLQEMMLLLHKDGAKGFRTTYIEGKHSVDVTQKAAKTLQELLPARRHEEGSVEGTLETISVHTQKKITIYESITRKGVTCVFPKSESMSKIADALGKKVAVSGTVWFNIKDEPVRIEVKEMAEVRRLGWGKELPTTEQMMGSDPDFTGELNTDEFIERIRSG